MAKASKATKKFQSQKLDGVLKRRKEHKKNAQQFKTRRPKKSSDGKPEEQGQMKSKKDVNEDLFESMDVDEFFAGGFEKAQSTTNGKEDEQSEEEDTLSASDAGSEDSIDAGTHKDQLNELAKTDPDFFKYLEENDAELLNFENEADSEQSSDAETSVHEKGPELLTIKMIEEWRRELKETTVSVLSKIILAFRAAAHLNEESEKRHKYTIEDPDTFQQLTSLAVVEIPKFMERYLPLKKSSSGRLRVPLTDKRFVRILPYLKTHSASLLHFLADLSDSQMQKRVLDATLPLTIYMSPFKSFIKNYVKVAVGIWSTSESDVARVSAFITIRDLFLSSDMAQREATIKQLYSAFVKEARNISIYTLPLVNLMKSSGSELFGLDPSLSYQLIFGFLRQLAIVLRKATNEQSKDSSKTVYNWQFVNSLDFWSLTLSQHAAAVDSSLRPLIYPFVQVTLGVIKLMPTAQFFPLRFHLIRALNRVASMTNTYIPVVPLLFEVLEAADMKKRPALSTAKPMVFEHAVRAKAEYLKTRVYQDQVGDIVIELLLDFYAINSTSIGFPELAIPAVMYMKRYMKKTKNAKIGRGLAAVVERLNANAKFIEQRRENVSFDPKNIKALEDFSREIDAESTPLGTYVKTQRKMQAEQKALLAQTEKAEDSDTQDQKPTKHKARKGKKSKLEERDELYESESE